MIFLPDIVWKCSNEAGKASKRLKRMAEILGKSVMTAKNQNINVIIFSIGIFNATDVTFVNSSQGHRDVCMSHIQRNY